MHTQENAGRMEIYVKRGCLESELPLNTCF
jgi:hypothetical protein